MNDMRKLMEAIQLINENDIDPETGDIRTHNRDDAEFMQDIIKLTDEADEILMDEDRNPAEQLSGLVTVLQDISNITRLRASGRPYAPIHEADIEEGIFGDAVTDVGRKMSGRVLGIDQVRALAKESFSDILRYATLLEEEAIDPVKAGKQIREYALEGIRAVHVKQK